MPVGGFLHSTTPRHTNGLLTSIDGSRGLRRAARRCASVRGGCWLSWWLFVAWLGGAKAERCWLASLQLRSGPKPVDLVPAFAPGRFAYSATLDFGSTFYDVDASAQAGCEVDSVPTQDIPVQPGETSVLTVYAKDPETDLRQAYVLTVTRMIGTETTVQALRIEGATLTPGFVPEVRAYTADLDLGYDTIRVVYKLMDVGQKLRITASPQVPAGTSLDLATTTDVPPWTTTESAAAHPPGSDNSSEHDSGSSGANSNSNRRLLATGEVQYLERAQSFLIDVGTSRRVTLTLESADPMQALRGVYTLDVTRPSCTLAKPLYSPVSKTCTMNCPAGFYANVGSRRCSKCNTNCASCTSLLSCELCRQDTYQYHYIVRPDGSCAEEVVTVEGKYRWWVIGSFVFAGFVVCCCLCAICICLYELCFGSSRSAGGGNLVYSSDSDSELDSMRQGAARSSKRRRRRRFCCCC